MTGKYEFKVYSNKIIYEFSIKRNITFIYDNSGKGKSLLINYINIHNSGLGNIRIDSTDNVRIEELPNRLDIDTIKSFLSKNKNTIFITDEDNSYSPNELAKIVEFSDNYFIFVSRVLYASLPFSMFEILKVHSSKRGKVTCNNLTPVYDKDDFLEENINFDIILTEDSNSGFQMFDYLYKGIEVISAEGKDNLSKIITNYKNKNILVILDSSAFGSSINLYNNALVESKERGNQIVTICEESFEYLLLKCLINNSKLSFNLDELNNTYNYCDSVEYFSWERFFTKRLSEFTRIQFYKIYTKDNLPEIYRNESIGDNFKCIMRDILGYNIKLNTSNVTINTLNTFSLDIANNKK